MSQAVQTRPQLLAGAVEAVKAAAAADATPLGRVRQAALARLEERGLPGDRESFRFTETGRLQGLDPAPAPAAPAGLELPDGLDRLAGADRAAALLVFVNGAFRADLSRAEGLPEGVVVGPLDAQDPGALAELLDSTEGRCAIPEDRSGFAALNGAGFQGGAYVFVPPKATLDRPVYLVYLAAACGEQAGLVQPRTLVVAGAESAVSVVELHPTPRGRTLTNAVTEVLAGPNSRVELTKVQAENPDGYHVAATRVVQERDSQLAYRTVQRGAPVTRNDLTVVLEGEGAACDLRGVLLGEGQDVVDDHVWVDHASAHASSQQVYKAVVGGKARGVFDGQILVRERSVGTSAHQQSRNLILSEDALVHSNPRLRIHNDDVKCSHGSTLGQLDREALFYLRSRGLPEPVARELLTVAFVADILESVGFEPLREWLGEFIRQGLPRGDERRGA